VNTSDDGLLTVHTALERFVAPYLKRPSVQILPIYAALLGFVFFYLSVRTIGLRRKLRIGIGSNENNQMLRAMRVHSNFAEYVPITLILILFVEAQGGPPLLVHALGALLLIGRSVHAYGVSQMNEKFVFRVSGMMMTFAALLVSACVLLFNAFVK
jgi:uncharacterized membrane protein YecN with MAPEG domain